MAAATPPLAAINRGEPPMGKNVIVFGWKRSVPGREALSGKHFQEFVQYLQNQVEQDMVESFEPFLLEPNGSAVQGFFLIRGEGEKLAALTATADWAQHQVRSMLHLEEMAIWRGVAGDSVQERMRMWMESIPRD
jgi:hypothetical protein